VIAPSSSFPAPQNVCWASGRRRHWTHIAAAPTASRRPPPGATWQRQVPSREPCPQLPTRHVRPRLKIRIASETPDPRRKRAFPKAARSTIADSVTNRSSIPKFSRQIGLGAPEDASRETLFGRRFGPEVAGSQDRHNLKIDQVLPAIDPRSQQFLVRRFHNLKTARPGRVHPTRVVHDVVRDHAPISPEAFADQLGIAMFEALDDHEQHGQESTRIRPQLDATRGADNRRLTQRSSFNFNRPEIRNSKIETRPPLAIFELRFSSFDVIHRPSIVGRLAVTQSCRPLCGRAS